MGFFGLGFWLPVIVRTVRPSIAGTPVWYAEADAGRTQLDINVTIPTGSSRKLILLWGSDGGEFPTAVTFDPAGVAFPMVPIEGAFDSIGSLRCAAYYLDTPPDGSKTVRITTTNAVWSVASLKLYQNARAGTPEALSLSEGGAAAISQTLDEVFLLDAYSESADLALGNGLAAGALTPFSGQTAGADAEINASFLATTSDRTHSHNGGATMGWTATAPVDLLMAVVNVLFSTGQIASGAAVPLIEWHLNESAGTFLDTHGRTNAAVQSGLVSGGHSPLFSGGGTSISMQGAQIRAEHHVDAQVPSWSAEIYLQPRAWPASGNDAILSKDSGLPVPGGFQVEIETNGAIDFYIRDATGLAGTSIHVTDPAGNGTLTLNVAHVIHITYDNDTKTAAIYLDRSLLASKTDANFFGLQNNTSPFSLFSRHLTSGVEFDGIGDRVTFFAGALTAAEIAAKPAPTTIIDPLAPGAVTTVSDNAGAVVQGTNDIDVLANDTGKTGPHYAIEITSDPSARLSAINNQRERAHPDHDAGAGNRRSGRKRALPGPRGHQLELRQPEQRGDAELAPGGHW
jgi:hypothetical protein